jgi:hypothetical protein
MRVLLLLACAAGLLLIACRPEAEWARLERRYQPDTEYTISVVMNSRRSLMRGASGQELVPATDEMFQELRTTQRLRLGPARDGVCRMEMDMLDYRVKEPGLALMMDLQGCLATADYDTSTRNLRWLGLADTTWTGGQAKADSGWALEVLGRDDAAAYLASSMELLASSLADTTRELLPGQGYQESRRQETTVGEHQVAWTEKRLVTLRALEKGIAKLDVTLELTPEPNPTGPTIRIEGGGSGKLEFDVRQRCTILNSMRSELSIEIDDGSVTWLARSETNLEITTAIHSWVSSGKE